MLDLRDPTAEEKDALAVAAALAAGIAIAEPPVELRRVVIPLVDADLDDGCASRRRSDERFGVAHQRRTDAQALKRGKHAEGPEMDDAFRCLSPEVDSESPDRPPVRQCEEEDDRVASFGDGLSEVVGLDRLLAVPLEPVEISLAERPNLDREGEVEVHASSMEGAGEARPISARLRSRGG